ncbi:MAG: hypothetical protein JSW07_05640, partial [bacterium]
EQGAQLLAEAVAAFQLALEVYSYQHLPIHWAMTQNNLAEAYTYLQDWQNTADCYANVLKVYPDYEEAYKEAVHLYHNVLFNFSKAFDLNQLWLEQHPDDLLEQIKFIEKLFTTSRFKECETKATRFIENKDFSAIVHIVVGVINVGNQIGLQKTDQIPLQIDSLYTIASRQPINFKIDWTFTGIKHFINQNEHLAHHRQWLIHLFEAVEQEDRESILAALQAVRESWK